MRTGEYTETVLFRAPKGLRSSISDAARKEGLSLSAYLRRLAILAVADQQSHRGDRHDHVTIYDNSGGLIAA